LRSWNLVFLCLKGCLEGFVCFSPAHVLACRRVSEKYYDTRDRFLFKVFAVERYSGWVMCLMIKQSTKMIVRYRRPSDPPSSPKRMSSILLLHQSSSFSLRDTESKKKEEKGKGKFPPSIHPSGQAGRKKDRKKRKKRQKGEARGGKRRKEDPQ